MSHKRHIHAASAVIAAFFFVLALVGPLNAHVLLFDHAGPPETDAPAMALSLDSPGTGLVSPLLPSVDGLELAPLEASLLELLNQERVDHDISPLQLNRQLVLLARERSEDMARRNYFAHVTPDGKMVFQMMEARGISYKLAGENLARNNFPEEESPAVAHKGFMESPTHAENELDPQFEEVGIGANPGSDGTIFFTELFADFR